MTFKPLGSENGHRLWGCNGRFGEQVQTKLEVVCEKQYCGFDEFQSSAKFDFATLIVRLRHV